MVGGMWIGQYNVNTSTQSLTLGKDALQTGASVHRTQGQTNWSTE